MAERSIDLTDPLTRKPTGELLGDLGHELGQLVSKEVQLAKAELRSELVRGARGVAGLAAAAVLGLLAVVLLSSAAAWGLAEVLPTGVAFLLVGLAYAGAAAVLVLLARRGLSKVDPVPHQTVETLKEDVQWATRRS